MIKKLVGLFVFSLGLLVCDAGLLLAQTSITITKVTDGQTGIVSFEGTYVVGAGETLEQVAIIVFDADNMSPGKTQKANVNNGKWDINYKTTAGDYVRAIATIITDANIVEDNKTPGDFTKGATKWVVK